VCVCVCMCATHVGGAHGGTGEGLLVQPVC
jgi:hypothetical protein